jgi:hypothetical protein
MVKGKQILFLLGSVTLNLVVGPCTLVGGPCTW